MNQDEKIIYCQKLVYVNGSEKNNILLGIHTGSDYFFIKFKTFDNEYLIPKDKVISISKTKEIFRTKGEQNDERIE